MTDRIANLRKTLRERKYYAQRSDVELDISENIAKLSDYEKYTEVLVQMMKYEQPLFIEGDDIGFYRSVKKLPDKGLLYPWGNVTPAYGRVLESGMDAMAKDICQRSQNADPRQREFYAAALHGIKAVLEYADRVTAAAKNVNLKLYQALQRVPHKGARTLYEACVFMKFMVFTLRCAMTQHVTLGHFDRYMYPYYLADVQAGVGEEEILETIENFFLSINFDTDLYTGIQQGDNGQSMVLGGRVADGAYEFNRLAYLCMQASLELNVIDPKINMRVCKDTPFDLYLLGTQLTKKGMGFPQYCNDDVVIPGLQALGYAHEDAVEYTVAACWEYIVPGCGMDIPNIITMNFPLVMDRGVRHALPTARNFDEVMQAVQEEIKAECDALIAHANTVPIPVSPYFSLFVDGCIERGKDAAECAAKYNNFGCHGAGISTAADALAAIKKTVFDDKTVTGTQMIEVLDANFEGYTALWHQLLDCPKMGNNDDYADDIACALMGCFSENMNGRPNNRGGVFRAGTGSAMEYIWSASRVGATADGRKAKEPFGCSFSPSLTASVEGPLSVIASFAKFPMQKIINGGPLTLEMHDTVFRNEMGVEKVAQLVKCFVENGGHQLQLNAVNRERLLDAKAHPENHRDLIVRVWGWSGYFNELAPEYQDHIIARTEFTV